MEQEYYQVKVKHFCTENNGANTTLNKGYLIGAKSCSEAEQKVAKELTKTYRGTFKIIGINVKHFNEIFEYKNDKKIRLYTYDEYCEAVLNREVTGDDFVGHWVDKTLFWIKKIDCKMHGFIPNQVNPKKINITKIYIK